jgi:hypothetical protein
MIQVSLMILTASKEAEKQPNLGMRREPGDFDFFDSQDG